MNKPEEHLEEIDSLFRKIITIHSSPSQESTLINYIADWLVSQQICLKNEIVSDPNIGILIQKKIIVNETSELKNGIMLCGHLDSCHLPSKEDLLNVSFERKETKLYFQNLKENEEMGLDDKTGVVSILKLLEDLKKQKKFKEFELEEVFSTIQKEENEKVIHLFVYFSICEEIGQKGILQFPIDQISSKIE
jgi:di/tripeptidase